MDLDPFYRRSALRIVFAGLGIVSGMFIKFGDLARSIHFRVVFAIKLGTLVLVDGCVTVHTNVQRRHRCMFAVPGIAMTVKTADLVDTRVYFMRIEDRLFRLIILRTSPDQ